MSMTALCTAPEAYRPYDPHPPARSALAGRRILLVEADTRHVLAVESALASHGAEVTLVRSLNAARAALQAGAAYDAAVVALSLPGGRGAGLVESLRRGSSPCLAVMRGDQPDRSVAHEIIAAGAIELLFDTHRTAEVVGAVERTVAATLRLRGLLDALDAPAAREGDAPRERVLRLAVHSVPSRPRTPRRPTTDLEGAVKTLAKRVRLSPREQSVLRFIAMGYRHQDIGAALAISTRTVKMHAANMRRKVGVSSRHELLREMFGDEGVPCP
jgi:DNA-binding NarL/FixJ family response regulator